ncbi:uncharacterized protein LOC106134473 [Amyelois transitella]|uniref:uncharacterized protein LOC106134473 n=1 Tax=Amyelois transitella TaxID=680683 RepID=UPI0029907D3A|nr:uncharacterized protein LOC106134473 [Amyelois transitella]
MPPKDSKKTTTTNSAYGDSQMSLATPITPRNVSLDLLLQGDNPGPGEWNFIVLFNGQIILDSKWYNNLPLSIENLPFDLKDPYSHELLADKPLIFMLRTSGGKGSKDPDPLLSVDNKAGGNVDLFPLLIGEEEVFTKVSLNFIATGEPTSCVVIVRAKILGPFEPVQQMPLTLTMISAHCMPYAKEGTVYIAAIGLEGIIEKPAVNFGMSLSIATANKIVWATASNGGLAANTAINVPNQDKYIPQNFEPADKDTCRCAYWNAMKRVLIDPTILKEKLGSLLVVEVAGVPRFGKVDVRGRYLAFIDANVLLEPGQFGVTACGNLYFYTEALLPPNSSPLLDIPPMSAKPSARETDLIMDELGHISYITVRLDLPEPLVPKLKITFLFDMIGFPPPDGPSAPVQELEAQPIPEDTTVDVRRIRKEGGALAIHRELSTLACRGAVPMNQGIKRTAANRLLLRVRTMLKQFPPGDCLEIDWQDTVTGQHAASRRAVTASFAPQPPALKPPPREAAARCRLAGDTKLAEQHIRTNLKIAGSHPRSLLAKALRCLEEKNELDARNYILEALREQTTNRFLLWIYGGQDFNKGPDLVEAASAAFRLSVKGDYSQGTANAIGWAALHALHHANENYCAAFVALKKMRKSYELPKEWDKFLQQWIETSGEEEIFWVPSVVDRENPLLIAAAFFLCLRCFTFCERLLKCIEQGCATRGSRLGLRNKITCDLYYVRAASLIIQKEYDQALEITNAGIKRFGPSSKMSQMRTSCLLSIHGWDGECEAALIETDKSGAQPCPALLLKAAIGGFKSEPEAALQRAARAHKIAPSAHSALTIARIYAKLGEDGLAERWAAASVKMEPYLADGWAMLALLAMYQRNLHKARSSLRTAKQVGNISADIDEELKKAKDLVQLESLSDSLVKNVCFCDYI